MSATDRFQSHEDIEWAQGLFSDGSLARIMKYPITECPSADTIGEFAAKSWRAGWRDADAGISADREAGVLPEGVE